MVIANKTFYQQRSQINVKIEATTIQHQIDTKTNSPNRKNIHYTFKSPYKVFSDQTFLISSNSKRIKAENAKPTGK